MSSEDLANLVKQRYREMVDSGADPQQWSFAWRTEANKGGFKSVDFLMREIVDTGKCIGCAACVVTCPVDVFDYKDEKPQDTRNDACVYCELCVDVCPVLRPPDKELPALLGYKAPVSDEGFGPYHQAFIARSKIEKIRAKGQDGGVVTTLLTFALEKGYIKGAIIGDVSKTNPQIPMQKLATSSEDLLLGSASRYTYSPNTVALADALTRDVKPIAVVGVPCQIDGTRHLQYPGIELKMAEWFRKNILFTVGLFCSEAFTHDSIDALSKSVNIDPKEIENINVKGKVILRLQDKREVIVSLEEMRKYARPACLYCIDYAADSSDIGVGGIGLNGWAFTVVRTEIGAKIFNEAVREGWVETRPVEEEPRSKKLLIRLSKSKRSRPLPALMPTLQERKEKGNLDPKAFETGSHINPPKKEN
ncbi:MAG: Coenzyme F420 hydrogenase/dehydrogenase, beta subunit C-terminal domain [Nitrososphaerales archaeon]